MPPKLFDDSDDDLPKPSRSQAKAALPPPITQNDDDDDGPIAVRAKKPATLYSDEDDEDVATKVAPRSVPKPKAVPRVIPKVASPTSASQPTETPPVPAETPAPKEPSLEPPQQQPVAVSVQPVVQQPVAATHQNPQDLGQAPAAYPPLQQQQHQQPAVQPPPQQPNAQTSQYPPVQNQAGYPPQQPVQQPMEQPSLQPFVAQPPAMTAYPSQQQASQAQPQPVQQAAAAPGYPAPQVQPQQQPPAQVQVMQQPAVAAPPPPPPAPTDLPKPPMPKPPSLPLVGAPAELPPMQNLAALAREQAGIDSSAWEAFQDLRKQLEESHNRTVQLHGQISQLQLSHEKEAQQYREAATNQQELLRKEWEVVTEHYNQSQAKVDSMTSILSRQAEQIMKKDQHIHELTATNASMVQNVAHVEDRAKLADNARQVAEVRQRELELSLEHSTTLVNSLRQQLSVAHEEKVTALQTQYAVFQRNREEIVQYYAERELKLLDGYNDSLNAVQLHMEANIKEREDKASTFWQETLKNQEEQYRTLEKEFKDRTERHETEMEALKRKQDDEKDKWVHHLKQEVFQLEQRQKEREEQVLADIARRERELSEREQRARVQRVQDEQDAKVALLTKEAELKAYYEKQQDDLRRNNELDRDRLTSAFREQLATISAQHLSSERELEKLHRDKEREMAQRYRVAGYEAEDSKASSQLKDVTAKTQTSLLSKFENIEARQRERAEQSRSAFRSSTSLSNEGRGSTSFSNVATTPSPSGSPKS